ncbi:maleylpyruvate isomerase family mycothiol-dependent enzyme [Embleya sp. AB8]|uniref:maleylpyruvate isomerase family mycothiol-dependent enzyme n=1 Tax=Embleya sp. AB8 TaxID=3156304 RepID=UPI003C767AFA
MDHITHFRREARAFETAARRALAAAEAPAVPSCPEWTVTDLVGHLGIVHRQVTGVIEARQSTPPEPGDPTFYRLPADRTGWPEPGRTPTRGPLPVGLVDWFAAGAEALATCFEQTPADRVVWTWSAEQSVGFWQRMQAIETAVHRWDAEHALGQAGPMAVELALDAIDRNFEVLVPARRARRQAPPGSGERLRFRRTDGEGAWVVCFAGDRFLIEDPQSPGQVEIAGTASDLVLFLWQRIPADRLAVTGDRAVLDRYFTLAPAV